MADSNKSSYVLVDRERLASAIEAMKSLDVRGFDSMDTLVALVLFFQQALNAPPIDGLKVADKTGESGHNETSG